MKIINLKQVLYNFRGDAINSGVEGVDLTLGEALANILLGSEVGGKMKMFVLAERCYKEEMGQFDSADFDLIKQAVASQKHYLTLVAGQVEKILFDLKDSEEK